MTDTIAQKLSSLGYSFYRWKNIKNPNGLVLEMFLSVFILIFFSANIVFSADSTIKTGVLVKKGTYGLHTTYAGVIFCLKNHLNIRHIAPRCDGWTIPLNYQSLHDCLKALRIGSYKNFGQLTIQDVMKKYWHYILFVIAFFLGMMILIVFFIKLNRDLKSSKKKIKKNKDWLRSIFRAAPTGIGVVTERILGQTNEKLSEITGYSSGEILGSPARLLYPSDEEYERLRSKMNDQIRKHGAGTVETSWKRKDGTVIDVLLSSASIDQSDFSKGITFTALDITDSNRMKLELAESEEKYRSMMGAIPDPVYICSPDYRVEYMNPAMISRTGGDATGELCYKALHDFNKKCSWCKHDKIQQGISFKADILSPKDNRSYHVFQSPIVHSNGSISIMTIFKDITKMLEMESQLHQAQKMESIGTLAGGIAHDFNNILFPIVGYTEMLLEQAPDGSSLKQDLSSILVGALQARDLVRQILTFSRQREHDLKPLKVQLIVNEALKLIRSTLPATIEISMDVKKDCGLIMADPTQIHQVIMNLITNAYHAMEDTGGNLNITLKKIELGVDDLLDPGMEPGTYVCLTVADTGVGMDKSIIRRIFDPYFTTKEEGKGTGLGLSVVHGIVKSHSGHISVYSEPGKGTEFHIYLPEVKIKEKTDTKETASFFEKGHEKILLVDDRHEIVSLLPKAHDKLGYSVTSRTSSIECLKVFRADPYGFDLIITDLTMPNMTGDKLASEIMKIRPDIPVVLCTGFSEKMSKEKARSLGIKGLLLKPVAMRDLSNAIRKALEIN